MYQSTVTSSIITVLPELEISNACIKHSVNISAFFHTNIKNGIFFNNENHIAFQSSLITVSGATKLLFILSLVHYAFYNVLLLVTCVQSKREFFGKCKVYFRSFYITIECVSQRSNMKPIIAWGSDYERRM